MTSDSKEFVVAEARRITGRGTVALPADDPRPWWPWMPHHVRITTPAGTCFESIAVVEFARKAPPGEIMVLLFPDKEPDDLVPGTRIVPLGSIDVSGEDN